MSVQVAVLGDRQSGPLFNRIVTCIAYAYLMRVPILTGVFLFLFPLLALSRLRSLLQNLFVLSVEGTLWTTVMALVLCWSILLTARLVLLNGYRFRLPQALSVNELAPSTMFFIAVLAAPLILAQFVERHEFGFHSADILWRIAAVLAGGVIAYGLAFTGLFLAVWVSPPGLSPADEKFLAPKFLKSLLKWTRQHGIEQSTVLPFGTALKRLPRGLWIGYLDPVTGLPWAGHWMAFTFALAVGVVTLALDFYRRADLGDSSPVPALCYIMILLLNLNWVMALFAFLLDRYRLPLIIPLAVFCTIGANAPSSDHYYSSQTGVSIERINPYDVLHARQGKPIVLVATAGGGIQAGAWTTEVLSGLEELSQTQWKTKYNFAECLTLVSSVSGGATGSMYFLNLYDPGSHAVFQDQKLKKMKEDVEESSVDDIAWALVYRDPTRILFPYLNISAEEKLLDRGYVLEETWRKRGGIRANLSDWRAGVREGLRPAVIFNSTVSETGEPFLLSNTDLDPEPLPPWRLSFYNLYPNTDLPVVTAVRLAATFPYVTPASRILSPKPQYHMIDGGYYDNPGVSSLGEWIDEGLRALAEKGETLPEHILIIQIRSFPDETKDTPPTNRGWFFQAIAPIKGLLSVRTTAQLVRDRSQLTYLARLWASTHVQGSLQDRVRFATFTFDGTDAPLSWAMNQHQKDAITEHWNEILGANTKDLRWVHCTFDAQSSDCSSDERNGPY